MVIGLTRGGIREVNANELSDGWLYGTCSRRFNAACFCGALSYRRRKRVRGSFRRRIFKRKVWIVEYAYRPPEPPRPATRHPAPVREAFVGTPQEGNFYGYF
ncbi:MAG: hypothetical protein FWE84_00390 [Firmicutes bacterium]|nr:hypothetical protein [Bacillota bacterium]